MFEGRVSWYKNGEYMGTFPNSFVYDGREAVLDWMFGLDDWRGTLISGSGISVYVALGTSTDTNDGIEGPDGSTTPDIDGPWQGVDLEDSRLSNEVGRIKGNFTRVGQMVQLNATFTDSEIGTGAVDFRELGVFLSNTAPTGDPSTYKLDRPNAMLIRSVRYESGAGVYTDNPLERGAGEDITVRYEFGELSS